MLPIKEDHIKLPKVLLVTEATLSKDGGGISQTLYNLLADYPLECVKVYTPAESLSNNPPSSPFEYISISYSKSYFPSLNNRFGLHLNSLIQRANIQIHDWLPIHDLQAIKRFSPDVVLICPNEPLSLIVGNKILMHIKRPYLIYFMDDWMDVKDYAWFTGSLQSLVKKSLTHADGWIMISEQLKKILSERYQMEPQRMLIAHNPASVNGRVPDFSPKQKENFSIVYAGSIWPMHYDALLLVAKAVYRLKKEGVLIELKLFTKDNFWEWRRTELEKLEVVYGGFIPYDHLTDYLQTSDLLLVTSSFLPEYASFSRSSVQTKITDYMKSGIPILSIGPEFSACNDFINKWDCGWYFQHNDDRSLSQFISQIISDTKKNTLLAETAYQVLCENFKAEIIRTKFVKFIQETVSLKQPVYE